MFHIGKCFVFLGSAKKGCSLAIYKISEFLSASNSYRILRNLKTSSRVKSILCGVSGGLGLHYLTGKLPKRKNDTVEIFTQGPCSGIFGRLVTGTAVSLFGRKCYNLWYNQILYGYLVKCNYKANAINNINVVLILVRIFLFFPQEKRVQVKKYWIK